MAKQGKEKELDITTEEKIIEAARKVFIQKGYAATRTRDIAEEAGINLALLNYYFRSKERLFQQVMSEKFRQLISFVFPILNNDNLSLEEKMEALIAKYIDLLLENPDLPIFVLSEVHARPERFKETIHIRKLLDDSSLVRQLRERRPDLEPTQFIVSLLGMTIFPFIARQIIFSDTPNFAVLMEKRKDLIVKWGKAILEA